MLTLEMRGGYSWELRGTSADVMENPQEFEGQKIPTNSVIFMQDLEKIAYLDDDRVWKNKGVPVV